MKKVLIAFLFVGIFFLTGCNKGNTIVGKWAHGSFIYTFNKDKTCSYSGGSTNMECTYEIDGDNISILYKGNTIPFKTTFKIDGKKLIIKDSFGTDVEYIKK